MKAMIIQDAEQQQQQQQRKKSTVHRRTQVEKEKIHRLDIIDIDSIGEFFFFQICECIFIGFGWCRCELFVEICNVLVRDS